ncbi:MAG: hypothetical protein ACM34I_09540 [bacterium]
MNQNLSKCCASFAIWTVIVAGLFVYMQSKRMLAAPVYLTAAQAYPVRYMSSEASVFQVFDATRTKNIEFPLWFNALTEEQKRGFILFIRSAALSSLLGDKISFTDEEWLSASAEKIAALTDDFLKETDTVNIIRQYTDLYTEAEHQRALFLKRNPWLRSYLGENYTDFEKGLFYFFSEHACSDDAVLEKADRFSALMHALAIVSDAVIGSRENNTRISPKGGVSDEQIREIVAASYFMELFYGIPADFMLLINAYETNFSMEFWEGGSGTTQQTTRAANTVLHSDYWIDKVQASSGMEIRLQMVPMSALDNVFLCITEAAKTIAVKAAELNIKTDEISPAKTVRFAGKLLPATWATAYKYNGSRKYAKQYAEGVHRYYRERKSWLKSYRDTRHSTYALNQETP